MRKIEFRGKYIGTGEWIYGGLADECTIVTPVETPNLQSKFIVHRVDPETVGQLIDLPDTRKRKFFEGDILSIGYDHHDRPKLIASIVWERDHYELQKDGITLLSLSSPSTDSMEIVGNIHDKDGDSLRLLEKE